MRASKNPAPASRRRNSIWKSCAPSAAPARPGRLRTAPARDFFRIAAVCDLDAAKARQLAEELKVKAYTRLADLLADDEILS